MMSDSLHAEHTDVMRRFSKRRKHELSFPDLASFSGEGFDEVTLTEAAAKRTGETRT